ncbi:MAG: ABC transporter ATP-binding protein [Pelagibacteraceae bacterium]|jgi:ABC-type oligopeptide transport system ATPase subunit|nr:ABC transporter ATP-binding protein [Pelagibacteraceae bacterium]MBT3902274.1 ABC transporter ATP-binding protein [Pelagibacteraceae bacterium]MBT4646102.1 ABC transporter ATP-binding protein [Pelagibacteraceae bacterium]MBT4950436.1 ABC transporter ATP-binding protein [Pelagibacteraceae bacterium]MBT5214498.1 ABC transporter ATP-binding protein [Pelagibacteraceae bacterium]
MSEPLLKIQNVKKIFKVGFSNVIAVNDVSFNIEKHDSVSIVGESGSGKTTLANLILGIEEPTAGTILYNDKKINFNDKGLRKKIQFVQQNPLSSLNPKKTIYQTLELPLKIHNICPREDVKSKIIELLRYVDLDQSYLERHPYSLSGGQRQRISVARALACEPEIIIFDEPTSALDVLIQLKILNLLAEIKEKLNLTYIFITHDLAVVRNISDKTIVMNKGNIVEMNDTQKVFESPKQEYTKELIRSIPTITDEEEAAKP